MVFAGVVGLVALLVLRMIWQSRQWNRAELRISTLPGVIGGPFAGAVILQQTFPPGTIFDVNLKCEMSVTTRHNNKSETKRVDLWSSTIHIQEPLKGGPAGTTALPVNFAIPFNAAPTGLRGNDTVRWALSVQKKEEVSTGGASFEIQSLGPPIVAPTMRSITLSSRNTWPLSIRFGTASLRPKGATAIARLLATALPRV